MQFPENFLPHVFYVAYAAQRDPSWALDGPVNHWTFTLVQNGSIDYILNDEPLTLEAGDAMLTAPNIDRRATASDLTVSAFDFFAPPPLDESKIYRIHLHEFAPYLKLLEKMSYAHLLRPEGYQMTLAGLALQMIGLLRNTDAETADNPAVLTMKEYIARYYMHPLTVKEIAGIVSLSPAYCGQMFRVATGCSIREYINQVRVNHACALIESENCRMREVAQLTGFCDEYYFSRIFKEITGMTPTLYRQTSNSALLHAENP